LKIAPEAARGRAALQMMKPGVGAYYKFKELFDRYSKEAARSSTSFLISSPLTRALPMRTCWSFALWLKKNRYRADQVQAFLPSADGDRDGHVSQRQESAAQDHPHKRRGCAFPRV